MEATQKLIKAWRPHRTRPILIGMEERPKWSVERYVTDGSGNISILTWMVTYKGNRALLNIYVCPEYGNPYYEVVYGNFWAELWSLRDAVMVALREVGA